MSYRPHLTPAALARRAELAANPPAPYVVPAPRRRYPEGAWPDPCDATGMPVFGTPSWALACILGDFDGDTTGELAAHVARMTSPAVDERLPGRAACLAVMLCRIFAPVTR